MLKKKYVKEKMGQLEKYVEIRPWGAFEQFCQNEQCTVKIITVQPNQAFSLQYHNHRDEFWKILSGTAHVVVGEQAYRAKEGDEFFVQKKIKHRVQANSKPVKILEIAFGKFDEGDVMRVEDRYGRK